MRCAAVRQKSRQDCEGAAGVRGIVLLCQSGFSTLPPRFQNNSSHGDLEGNFSSVRLIKKNPQLFSYSAKNHLTNCIIYAEIIIDLL